MNKESDGAGGPVCSVCIANYNGTAFVAECIDSVLAQRCDFPFQVIVHDDASPDGSAAFIRQRYPQLTLIESTENVGFCTANNRMTAASQSEFILLLNNDAVLLPGALAALHDAALRLGRDAMLGLPQYDAASGVLIDMGSRLDLFLNTVPHRDKAQDDVAMIMGACLWTSRKLWDDIGGFPETFRYFAEDTYVGCLARLFGYPVKAVAQSGFRHWGGKSLGGGKSTQARLQTNLARRSLSERNKNLTMLVTYPMPALVLLFPLHALLLLAEGALLSLLKRRADMFLRIYLASLAAPWHERAFVARERARVQAKRAISSARFFSVFQLLPQKLRLLLRHGLPQVD